MLFAKIYNKLSENHKKRLNNKMNRSFINNKCRTNETNKIIIGGSGLGRNIKR